MVATLDDFPPHILSTFMGDVLAKEPGNITTISEGDVLVKEEGKTQVSVITICSAFFLAGVPHIYQSPRVGSKIVSFFLHNENSPPANLQNLDTNQLVSAGYTKLAALRFVQDLHIAFPQHHMSSDESYYMLAGPKKFAEADEKKEDDRCHAEQLLRKLPDGIMPRLNSLQVDTDLFPYVDMPYDHPVIFAGLLLERTNPKTLCLSRGQIDPSLFSRPFLADKSSRRDIPILCQHTYMFRPFTTVPGSTTYLYLTRNTRYMREGRRMKCCKGPGGQEKQEDPQKIGTWLGEQILGSLRPLKDTSHPLSQSLIDTTRVIIGELAGNPVITQRIQFYEPGETWLPLETRSALVLKTLKAVLKEGNGQMMDKVIIEGMTKEDMPECLICGQPGTSRYRLGD